MGLSLSRLAQRLDETLAYVRIEFMRALAPSLGLLLFCNWVVAVVGFRQGQEAFADFFIEMPALTRWIAALSGSVLFWPATGCVAFSSIMLAGRTRAGWWLSVGVCLLCGLMLIGHLLSIYAIFREMSDGAGVTSVFAGIPASGFLYLMSESGSVVPLVTFALAQIIFAALIFMRRHLIK
jgi:hypothetical protein